MYNTNKQYIDGLHLAIAKTLDSGGNSPYMSSFSNPQDDGNCSNCGLCKIHHH